MNLPAELLGSFITGLIMLGGVSVQLKWLRRDTDRAQATADDATRKANAANSRLDRLNAPPAAG